MIRDRDCGNCHNCLEGAVYSAYGLEFPVLGSRMILCPDCGCKRCPKASDHMLDCTQSNESGQPGSVYK